MSKAVTGIKLAGADRRLFYRVRDMYDMEGALGGESLEEAISRRGYRRLVAFLWAGLRHEDEKLTQQAVIRLLDRSDLDYSALWDKVASSLSDSGLLPRTTAEENGADPTSAPRDGTTAA